MSWFYDRYNLYTVQIYLFLLLTQSSEPTKRIYLNRNLSFYYDKFDHLHFIRNVITEVACTKAKLPVAAWPLVYRIPGFLVVEIRVVVPWLWHCALPTYLTLQCHSPDDHRINTRCGHCTQGTSAAMKWRKRSTGTVTKSAFVACLPSY